MNKKKSMFSDSYNLSAFTTIRVNYKDIVCIKYRRDIHQNWDTLMGFKQICLFKHNNIDLITKREHFLHIYSCILRSFWFMFRWFGYQYD